MPLTSKCIPRMNSTAYVTRYIYFINNTKRVIHKFPVVFKIEDEKLTFINAISGGIDAFLRCWPVVTCPNNVSLNDDVIFKMDRECDVINYQSNRYLLK
jgi:hypothetical protein